MLICSVIIISVLYLFFNYFGSELTGFALQDSVDNSGQIFNESILDVTKKDAKNAINESEKIIKEMEESGLSIDYVNDTLIEAKRIFDQLEQNEILNDLNSSYLDKQEARKTLRLVDIKKVSYALVINYTSIIKARREQAFLIKDSITILEKSIETYHQSLSLGEISGSPTEESALLENAKTSFREDRYDESQQFIDLAQNALVKKKSEHSMLVDLKNNVIGFIQKYWLYLIFIIMVTCMVGFMFYKKIKLSLLKGRVKKAKTEQVVLINLIKKCQTERFKDNKISGLVYNIKMNKYNKRLNEIKQRLPVLEERLNVVNKQEK
jgi:hypothetical protein